MAVWLDTSASPSTLQLLEGVLLQALQGERVQFICDPSAGPAVVQRLRVALSRSRERNKARGKKLKEFTLRHEIYPYTQDGIRHDCVVMWIEKSEKHLHRELLDDIVERSE